MYGLAQVAAGWDPYNLNDDPLIARVFPTLGLYCRLYADAAQALPTKGRRGTEIPLRIA